MNTFKRILAWILVVISILGILVCSVGVVGSWVINDRLTEGILNLLSSADTALGRVENSLDMAATQLQTINSAMNTVRDAAAKLGDRIENNSPVLDLITQTLREEIGPTVIKVRDMFQQIEERVQTINSTITALNALPGIEIQTLDLKLEKVYDKVNTITDAVQQLQQNIADFRAGIVTSLAPLMGKLDMIASFLSTLEQDVNTYLKQVQNLQAIIQQVQVNIPGAIDRMTIVVTVLFIWSILAQVSLVLAASLFLKTGRMVWEFIPAKQSPEALPQPGG